MTQFWAFKNIYSSVSQVVSSYRVCELWNDHAVCDGAAVLSVVDQKAWEKYRTQIVSIQNVQG